MTTFLIQDSAGSITLFIEDTAGAPATGLAYTDVTADLKKEGGSFVAFTLTALNWTELDEGFYEVDLADTDTGVLGNTYLRVQGGTVRTSVASAYVAALVPATPPSVTPPTTVAIFGYVYSPSADPIAGARVTARTLGTPTVVHPGSEGVLIGSDIISVETDAYGFFTMDLIAGTNVAVNIGVANYKRTFLVPSSSTNIFDIP
jgi:hypothetical protein